MPNISTTRAITISVLSDQAHRLLQSGPPHQRLMGAWERRDNVAANESGFVLWDWARELVIGALVLIMGWLYKTSQLRKMAVDLRLTKAEEALAKHIEMSGERHGEHEAQLRVIHTNQDHLTNRLNEIRECTQDTTEKVSELSEKLTDVLIAMRK